MLEFIQSLIDKFIVPKYIGLLVETGSDNYTSLSDIYHGQVCVFDPKMCWRQLECYYGGGNYNGGNLPPTSLDNISIVKQIPNYFVNLLSHFAKGYLQSYVGQNVEMSLFGRVQWGDQKMNLGFVSFQGSTLYYLM